MAIATLFQDPKAAHFANILLSNQTLDKNDALNGTWWKTMLANPSTKLNLSEFSDVTQANSKVYMEIFPFLSLRSVTVGGPLELAFPALLYRCIFLL